MDGDDGMGLVVSRPAMTLAMEKAAEHGIGAVTIRNSNHYGMAAYWSMMALERDMIGYTTTNASPTMAPWGGITLSHGNNPISYSIPAGKEWPLVLDIAMSVVAKGKLRLAALKNEPIPSGWAMDKFGQPTTDVQDAIDGILMPIAGHKGYGMALVNDVLSGILSGGLSGSDIPQARAGGGVMKMGYCHFFMALDISHFTPVAEFKERVDRLVRMMKSSQLAPGQNKIYLPGEIEFETEHQRLREGIPYDRSILSQLEKLARDLNMPAEF
jgi:LDH2 family malate/lactate/ureidoglycolate dehydrogenase